MADRAELTGPELVDQTCDASPPQLAVQLLYRSGSMPAGRRRETATATGHDDVLMEPVFRLSKAPPAELRERLLLADVVGELGISKARSTVESVQDRIMLKGEGGVREECRC